MPSVTAAFPRRKFLSKGVIGGALLVCGGAGIALWPTRKGRPPRHTLQLPSPSEHAVLAAAAARIVPQEGEWPSTESLDVAEKIDALMATTAPTMGVDFKRLLGLLENGLFALALTGRPTPFTRLSPEMQDHRLEAWRRSRLMLLRSGHAALVRLVHAAYYSSPEVYPLVGYPGPPVVPPS
jgi:Gluconate 2-dehydrogenase subunit 3